MTKPNLINLVTNCLVIRFWDGLKSPRRYFFKDFLFHRGQIFVMKVKIIGLVFAAFTTFDMNLKYQIFSQFGQSAPSVALIFAAAAAARFESILSGLYSKFEFTLSSFFALYAF